MRVSGESNPAFTIESLGVKDVSAVHYNDRPFQLVQKSMERREADLGPGGAVRALTGVHTGRSPKDKFVVKEPSTEATIWWGPNAPMSSEHFERLRQDMFAHMRGREYFVQDLYAGADPAHRLNVRIVAEFAWHALFIRHLLRRPACEELASFTPAFTVINCPSFSADPGRHGCRSETVIAISFERKMVLIGGTSYAGENKKSVFSVLNYLLPEKGVMPMHCSANHATGAPEDSAIFFGLSGTGKTTLSADPKRILIGDDEHGWTDTGIFNFEGGCYAKTINLLREKEPEIYDATTMFGSVLENVVINNRGEIDFDDNRYTENGRVAYPLSAIPNASATGRAGVPKHVIMLTCDAFGVLPPIARLTPAQAKYHFLSGFTAKAPGTEKGVAEPVPTFSTCFGAPFMPRRPEVYGDLLGRKIAECGATCWLVSTGWTGGAHGVGKRMPIHATRALLTAALTGALDHAEFYKDPFFDLEVPVHVPSVDDTLLNPRSAWPDPAQYDMQAKKLLAMFQENFAQYSDHVGQDVRDVALSA